MSNQPPLVKLRVPKMGKRRKEALMGGKPSKGTKKDKRLKGNKGGRK